MNLFDISSFFSDLTMYKGSYFWSTERGTVLTLKHGVATRVTQEQEASALAFEPLANMLYWANPKHNMVNIKEYVRTGHLYYGLDENKFRK